MKKIIGRLLVLLFILMIGLPMVQTVCPFVAVPVLRENRYRAKMPVPVGSTLINGNFMEGFNGYFNDHYGFRDFFIRANKWICFYVFRVSDNPQVTIGRDNFLFINDTLNDYHRIPTISEAQAADIARKFKKIQDELALRGVKFLFVMAPNTNTIYGENMPFPRKNPKGVSNYNRIKGWFDRYEVNYLDPVPMLMREKRNYLLYYKRDTHWNHIAGAMVADEILRRIHPDGTAKHYVTVKGVKAENHESDLNIMLGIDPRESAWQPVVEENAVQRKIPKTVWIYDSYSWAIFPYARPYFSDLQEFHLSETAFHGDIASNMTGTKVMVFEMAERGLPYLLKMDYDFLDDRLDLDRLKCEELQPEKCWMTNQVARSDSDGGIYEGVSLGADPQLIWTLPVGVKPKYLVLDMNVPVQDTLQIFWRTVDMSGLTEGQSAFVYSEPSRNEYIFDLRKIKKINCLRLDPCTAKGVHFRIRSIKLYY